MSNAQERLNKIIASQNQKQQNVSDRLDNIISNYNNRSQSIPSRTQRTQIGNPKPSLMDRINQKINADFNPTKLAEYKAMKQFQQEEQRKKEEEAKIKAKSNSYYDSNNLTNEQKKILQQNLNIPDTSDIAKIQNGKVSPQQFKVYNVDNVSKDLGVSKEEAEKMIKKSNSLPSKIKQTYTNSFGENGFAGINALINEIKKTPEVLQEIRETSVESPMLMGIRGSMAGMVDAGTSEIASLFETPEEEKWYEKNVIARQAKTYKRVFDKAQKIKQNGGNALDVIWGAGSTLATDTVKNTMDNLPTNQITNKMKKSTQAVLGNTIDEDTRKQVQKAMLNLTDSYYQDRTKYQENESKKSKTQQYIDTVIEGTSRMGGSIATSYVTENPNIGLIATGLSAKGSATQEALREGATLEQAIDIGNLSGLVEMATEKIWSGIKMPGGKSLYGDALGDSVENFILSKLKTKGGKWLASKGLDIAGEIAEEFISDTLESVAKQGIYDDNAKLPTLKDYWNTATTTAGTTVLLNLLTGGFLQTPNINNQNNENIVNQNTELQEQVQKASREYVENNNITNLEQITGKNQNIKQQQQITQTQNENGLNQNVEGQNETKFSKMLNNKKLPMQNFVYEKSDNVKVDNLRQQASKFFNNSNETQNYVSMLEKIIKDKNVAIEFDDTLGEGYNGSYKNGVIRINPNSERAGEFIAIHELTHAIGNDNLVKIIDNYRKSNVEFDNEVNKLLKKYNATEINEEALADISAQLYGNQNFINEMSQKAPNVFKRIYNELKYLWHQFTGYKNQNQFLDDLMFKWEQAYRNNNELNQSANYLKGKFINGESTVVSEDYNGTNPSEKQAKASLENMLGIKYINENNTKEIMIENKDIDKFLHDGYNNYKNAKLKKRISGNYGEVIEIAKEDINASKGNYKNSNRGKEGYDYYNVNITYPIRDNQGNMIDYKSYEARLVVRKDNGGKFAYDLDNFKQKKGAVLDKETLSIMSGKPLDGSVNNSISQNNQNVKNDNTTKHSIQENENNSSSFNLPQTDNNGNVLSKKQQNYFKDSKVRDENGNLKVVYHGTNKGGFTVFNRNYNFFTDNQEVANTYTGNKGVYEGYLDIKNPINIEGNNEKWSMIDVDNIAIEGIDDVRGLLKEYGASTWQEKGKLRTSTADIVSAISDAVEEGKIDADGIIINNIEDDGGYSDGKGNMIGTDYVVFKSNQFKDINNLNPTSNPDIRFSKNNGTWQDYLEKQFPSRGERTYFKDILPTKETVTKNTNLPQGKNVDSHRYSIEEELNKILKNKSEKNKINLPNKNVEKITSDLSDKNKAKIQALKDEINQKKQKYEESNNSQKDMAEKRYKATIMQNYAEIRRINQGDWLIPVEGGLTEMELANKIQKLKSNYIGKEVLVDNKKATIVGNAYGNVKVEFEDGTRQTVNRDSVVPVIDIDTKIKEQKQQYQEYLTQKTTGKIKQTDTTTEFEVNLSSKQVRNAERISANIPYKDTTTKIRKHYKSIIESGNTTDQAKAISKKLMDLDTYIPESNKGQLEQADLKITNSTPEAELQSLMSRATIGEKITSVDIAVGERLIEYYSKIGDGENLQEAIQATAMAGTTAGQTVQAMSLLNHMTPQGQAVWLQRSVEKMNNKLQKQRGKNAPQFDLTSDMLQKIVSSENDEQLAQNLNEVYEELGQQVSKSTMEKVDAWRYFSMLANPRTHIRNIVGNKAMAKVQGFKNKVVAGSIEGVVAKFNKNMERNHTIVPASKEVKQFAKNDIKNVTDRLGLTEGKLNPQTRLENNMKTFKHDALNKTVGKLFELNNNALEAEDGWGLKAGYRNALAEYMTANKLKPDTITDAQLAKARNYAVQQAKEATFHQECQLASLINQLSNRNKFAKYTVDAILPFKKTPMNIAKTGIEYSPVGLTKSIVLDTAKLRKGNITVNQYIDNISKGLTGTGIALVGYALAQAGVLKASGGADDKEEYEENRGKQAFSIQIGDNTYSLDWLAPTAIPLFIGAEISALNNATKDTKSSNSSDEDSTYNNVLKSTANVLDAFTNSMNPMMEMSMLSGLASTLKSYEQGASQGITAMGTKAVQSYVNQFFPTAMGQVAKTMDNYERSTTSTKSGMLPKAVDSTKNQIIAKIPGLRQTLPTKTDVWGNEMKQPNNIIQKGLENAVLPWSRKKIENDNVDKELIDLYKERGEKSILPSTSLTKDLTFNGEKYRMTSQEFTEYKKAYGTKSHDLINKLVDSEGYNKLTDEQKQLAIENIYKYAKEYAKDQYAKENDLEYDKDTLFKTVNAMEESNANVENYFNYASKTQGMKEKEKRQVLLKADYTKNDKKLIYENTIGSDDSLYNDLMKHTGININEYLKYKSENFESDKEDDGTETGKSISGSKKAKVYEYVNNMKINGNQRMLLLGTQYKLTDSERQQVANYVQGLKLTNKQKNVIYSKLKGFTVYKDGRVTY